MNRPNPLTLNTIESKRLFLQLLKTASVKNLELIERIIFDLHKYKSEKPLYEMRDKWYDSLKQGTPDYSIYESGEYLAEVWFCWETCSKKYLRNLQIPKLYPPNGIQDDNKDSELIVDMGNGVGITTAALRMMFPSSKIIGTNVEPSEQFTIALQLGETYDFTMVGDMRQITTQPDLAIAFEYFEHFEQPLQHLEQTIGATKPKRLLIANTFNQPATGHFIEYLIDDKPTHGSKLGRLFNNALRDIGYEKIKTKLWNNRPTYWKLRTNADL